MRTRWYIGAGLVAVALGVALLGGGDSYTWVIAVAGAFILVHAFEAGEVIEDLLTISRAERGILEMNLESVDLTSETATVIRRFSIEDKTIPFDSPDGPVWALVDAPRYDQILRNLVTNAVQYGGPNIQVSVLLVGDLVSVVVSDDGEGAHPSDAASIFQPYRRSRHVPAASESSGLGLWVSRTLARGMGGDLTYRHENDQTFFELTVPTSEKQGEATLSPSVLAA